MRTRRERRMVRRDASCVVYAGDIAGKTQGECIALLGEPTAQEDTSRGRKLIWDEPDVEILFIGDKADWITIAKIEAAFRPNSLNCIGLSTNKRPSFKSPSVMRWEGLRGLKLVSMFPDGDGKISYFYVQALTS